jgi:multicomponent Na+:H+ antiporter subunit G
MRDASALVLLVAGAAFVGAGTVGLFRFPDVLSRLHALAKADNVGFGLIVAGLVVRADSPATAVKLVLIWLLVLLASTTSAYLIAHRAMHRDGGA